MSTSYKADSIEVLEGLEPVKKRPGMYTDTSRPNHLAQEVIDNSVDEAVSGYATQINVTLHKDNSMSVEDNGRGIPIDIHPKEGTPAVEVILTKLHAGGKFSNDSYQFSGGLHGVGISVVNALSSSIEVWIKRDAKHYFMKFESSVKSSDLEEIGTVGKRNTGTLIKFMPDAQFFDSVKFSIKKLRHNLRSKAVLCPGLAVNFKNEIDETVDEVGILALSLGFFSSAITSYFAVSALLKLIKQQKFHYFTPYCIILGMFLIYTSLF